MTELHVNDWLIKLQCAYHTYERHQLRLSVFTEELFDEDGALKQRHFVLPDEIPDEKVFYRLLKMVAQFCSNQLVPLLASPLSTYKYFKNLLRHERYVLSCHGLMMTSQMLSQFLYIWAFLVTYLSLLSVHLTEQIVLFVFYLSWYKVCTLYDHFPLDVFNLSDYSGDPFLQFQVSKDMSLSFQLLLLERLFVSYIHRKKFTFRYVSNLPLAFSAAPLDLRVIHNCSS